MPSASIWWTCRLADMPPGNTIVFTFFWPDAARWENVDFSVGIDEPD